MKILLYTQLRGYIYISLYIYVHAICYSNIYIARQLDMLLQYTPMKWPKLGIASFTPGVYSVNQMGVHVFRVGATGEDFLRFPPLLSTLIFVETPILFLLDFGDAAGHCPQVTAMSLYC